MDEYDAKVENARLNEELVEFWVEQVDLMEIHKNTSLEMESRVVRQLNSLYDDLQDARSIVRGAELRDVYYDYSLPEYGRVIEK